VVKIKKEGGVTVKREQGPEVGKGKGKGKGKRERAPTSSSIMR
jgi:hypothetical protein